MGVRLTKVARKLDVMDLLLLMTMISLECNGKYMHRRPDYFTKLMVQHPTRCEIPTKSSIRRRLAESKITLAEAEQACSGVVQPEFDLCVFDVMATNDKDVAGAY